MIKRAKDRHGVTHAVFATPSDAYTAMYLKQCARGYDKDVMIHESYVDDRLAIDCMACLGLGLS